MPTDEVNQMSTAENTGALNFPDEILLRIIKSIMDCPAFERSDLLALRLVSKKFYFYSFELMLEKVGDQKVANFIKQWMQANLLRYEMTSLDHYCR